MFGLSELIIRVIQSTEFHLFACACHKTVALIICKSNPCYVCSCSCFTWILVWNKEIINCCFVDTLVCTSLTVYITFLWSVSEISYILEITGNLHTSSNNWNYVIGVVRHDLVLYGDIAVSVNNIGCCVWNVISESSLNVNANEAICFTYSFHRFNGSVLSCCIPCSREVSQKISRFIVLIHCSCKVWYKWSCKKFFILEYVGFKSTCRLINNSLEAFSGYCDGFCFIVNSYCR